MAIVVE